MSTPPPPARRSGLAILDIGVAVVLAIIGALIGIIFLGYFAQFGGLSESCAGIDSDGARCAPGFLSGMQIAGYAIVIFGWFITTGFIVVRVLRRRVVFFLPLIGVAAMIVGFYVVLAVVSASYLPSSST